MAPDGAAGALSAVLGHFGCAPTVVPATSYRPGQTALFDATICLGFGGDAPPPERLLSDILASPRPACWMGSGLEAIGARRLQRLGFSAGPTQRSDSYRRVVYRGQELQRPRRALVTITIHDPRACHVLATAEEGRERLPYAVRSGSLWWFADAPLGDAGPAGSHLVLCDRLHELLGRRHPSRHTALLVVGDVTPETDADALRRLTADLAQSRVPYAIAVAPLVAGRGEGAELRLSSRRRLVAVLRSAQRAGAAIIGLGLAEAPARKPLQDERRLVTTPPPEAALSRLVAELARSGLYPVAWATRGADPARLSGLVATVVSGPPAEGGAVGPGSLPFTTRAGRNGPEVLPLTLRPLGAGPCEVERVLEQARAQSVVSDAWVTVPVAPGTPLESLKLLTAALQDMEFIFADLRRASRWVKTPELQVHTRRRRTPLADVVPSGWDATLLGPKGQVSRFEPPGRDGRNSLALHPGMLLIAYPHGKRPHEILAFDSQKSALAQRVVQAVARAALIFAAVACAVFAVLYLVHVVLRWRTA